MENGIEVGDYSSRHRTAETLTAGGWKKAVAAAWAHSTADSAEEIRLWEKARFTPAQAGIIYANAHAEDENGRRFNHHDPTEWRDLALVPDLTVDYAEAWFSVDDVIELEKTGNRPSTTAFDDMKARNHAKNAAALRAFKAALRDDSEFAELIEYGNDGI